MTKMTVSDCFVSIFIESGKGKMLEIQSAEFQQAMEKLKDHDRRLGLIEMKIQENEAKIPPIEKRLSVNEALIKD